MTRGAKGTKQANAKAKAGAKAASKRKIDGDVPAKVPKKAKETPVQVLRKELQAEGAEVTEGKKAPEHPFTRSKKGREAIQSRLEQLIMLDSKQFSSNPAFSLDGACRMKYQVAEGITRQEMLNSAATAFEGLCLASLPIILIYFISCQFIL